jgi:penicillin-binding protein 1C
MNNPIQDIKRMNRFICGWNSMQAMIRRKRPVLFRLLMGLALCQLLLIGFLQTVQLPLFKDPYSFVLRDRKGALLGAAIAADEQWRFAPADKVPDKFIQALVCYEDRRFFSHPGIDPLAAARAAWQNLQAGRITSGASTITMQVIRLSRKGQPRNFKEKAVETVMALRLETMLTKKEILALYAAHAPFGGNVVGLAAASWRYFGRPPENLSWAEAAFLAVLPNSPGLVHPGKNRKLLLQRRDRLLARMEDHGIIDDLTLRLAMAEELPAKPRAIPMLAPHLLFKARQRIAADQPTATTTLDRNIQQRANQLVRRHLNTLDQSGIHNAGALILEVDSGHVLAYVGNRPDLVSDGNENHVDVISAPRSTGSILKPLLYGSMLDAGELLPTQLVADIPTRMGGFRPENYTRQYNGAVPAWMALARSLNIPAVRLLRTFGIDRFCAQLKTLGMTTLHRPAEEYGLSLILGGAEATLWEITGIYAGMARCVNQAGAGTGQSGAFFPPRYLSETPAETLAENQGQPKTMDALERNPLSPAACWLSLQAMLQVARPGVDSAWREFGSAREIAWKTGTSYGHRDAWAVGVTPRYAVGVWVGNADGEGRPELTGLGAAAPLMLALFDILDETSRFQRPWQGLEQIDVCRHSGYRAGPKCAHRVEAWATSRGLNTKPCPYCRIIHTDAEASHRLHQQCAQGADLHTTSWFVLPTAMEWYYRRKHSDYRPLPPMSDNCPDDRATRSISLIYPGAQSRIYIPVELDGSRGKTVFKAAHRDRRAAIYWHLDRNYLGTTREIHSMSLSPAPGRHKLTLVDETGEQQVHWFEVLAKER